MKALPVLRDAYVRDDICSPCGGQCCKRMPGVALPEDFGADEATMRATLAARLASGEWSIDWWEGDPRPGCDEEKRGYFLRPATVLGKGDVFDPSDGGACVFLEPTGCRAFETRPAGCRGLEPDEDGHCTIHYASKREAAIAWLPFAAIVLDVAAGLEERAPESRPSDWLSFMFS